jgi:hypothetical protein
VEGGHVSGKGVAQSSWHPTGCILRGKSNVGPACCARVCESVQVLKSVLRYTVIVRRGDERSRSCCTGYCSVEQVLDMPLEQLEQMTDVEVCLLHAVINAAGRVA